MPSAIHGLSEDAMWDAVSRRDPALDGRFFFCVATTGIYCRPSCPARPLRRNVGFARSAAEAEALGHRPCKRCGPERLA
jgi:methylphosphotriester-DNA--protein-cysteine methyltransferase